MRVGEGGTGGFTVVLEEENIFQFQVSLEIYVAFPPAISNASNLLNRLLLKVNIVLRGVDKYFVSSIASSHLEHANAVEVDLWEDSKGWKLVWHHTSQPATGIGRGAVVAQCKDFWRSHVFPARAKGTAVSSLGRFVLAPWFRDFGPVSSG